MKDKILSMLGSMRFWMVLLGAVVYYLAVAGVISKELGDAILGLLGVSVVVRTADKFR